MIIQHNISFDTYHGRIFDPVTTSKAFELIDTILKDRKSNFLKVIYGNFFELVCKYITSDRITVTNINDSIQHYYYVISHLFNKIIGSNINNVKEILHPTNYYQYILLKKYFIPLINLIDEVHDGSAEFNNVCYDYLLNGEFNHKTVHIIENINQSSIQINQMLLEDLPKYLKKNDLILTMTGCLFYKQEQKISLFSHWLDLMYKLRKEYIKKRSEFDRSSDDYSFYDSRQKATKVAMNTSYGLYGQSTFRYSNNWLAKTITTQGRLALKISQQVAENYLSKFGKKV